MIPFQLNGKPKACNSAIHNTLLSYLRKQANITSVKDGCSGEGTCGACLVQFNGKARLACKVTSAKLAEAKVVTLEGIPVSIRAIIAKAFVNAGAVQCGFCTPGFIMRAYILLSNSPNPNEHEIRKAISSNLCRCTGYVKIIEAIQKAAAELQGNEMSLENLQGYVGERLPKYNALKTALGQRLFTDDLHFKSLLFGALRFSDHPKAKILDVDYSKAKRLPGVIKIFTADDVPGERYNGLIYNDWPLMIKKGETTRYIGDVLAGVVAETEELARKAADLIDIEYDVFNPVVCPHKAQKYEAERVHVNQSNLLEVCKVCKGNASKVLSNADYVVSGNFETQRIEHAFLEKESAIAVPVENGIKLFSQSQGVYEDQRQVSRLLGLEKAQVEVELLPNGGGFGGKEDLSVQGHVALFAFLLQKPVKLTLSRSESIRMHPKRHPVSMELSIACSKEGKLLAAKLNAVGDTGAYASVGTKVMERVAGHATGGYFFPNVELEAKTVYTNNIPSGAMRGFGANQVTFALEVLVDELCEKGGFDRWQFRYNNALVDGNTTSTGQKVYGVGIQKCLLALKNDFYKEKYAGLACGIKNSGVGNGMVDRSDVLIAIENNEQITIDHGWTEMGQGVHTIAIQTLCTETGLSASSIQVNVNTKANIETGMTTSSRATVLLGLAIIDACKTLKADLKEHSLYQLVGRVYKGSYICDWTNKPGAKVEEPIVHFSYGYAAQLCILNEKGAIRKVVAAHDGGKIMNPMLFEGQVQGGVHMGLGYALSEDLPMQNGQLKSDKLKDCGVLRAKDTPEIEVRMIEQPDPIGPYGAKGVGEIGLVPTAGAVANAFYQFSKFRQYSLPLKGSKKEE